MFLGIYSHIARHTFITTVTLSNGVSIATVSKLLGHTKITTTQVYVRLLEDKISGDMKGLRSVLGK
ncbi:MAG: tyrosine-type recombinase/integrase [Muricauda sp.]|nr:tyrosine-type recombinase/integrase [Allomuricauda sp.]